MAEIVIAVAGKVSEYLVAPIGRQLGYLFCYRSHAEKLRNQVQTLRTARNDQQITVDEATRKGDEIRPAVREWLNRVDQITGEAEALALTRDDQNMSCLNGWCPNLISRYQLGREAYKKAQVIVGIQTARNFPDGISYRVPPRSATFKGYECFQSRDSTSNQIMDALRDDKTKMIGVCGMGGLGKTMLVRQVAQQAKQQNLFTTDIFIDVSWTRDSKKDEEGIAKIQQKIAEMLGYQFKGKDESTRADELKQRLQKEKEPEKEKDQKKEKILIILDDIWKGINLEKVGIPFKDDQTICKLVLVSRDENRLRKDMGAQECFQIQHLQGEEAWRLLKKIAGDSVEGYQLRPIAIKVLDKCGGLPIAIVTIAKALKDETVVVWKNALDELRSCAPINIEGMDEKVYSCLKWSYNNLKSDEVKSLFLLCGCLSYYGDISMDQMFRYAIGLDFFDDINSLERARNKLVTLVKTLKASSLLLDGIEDDGDGSRVGALRLFFMDGDHKSVRMHDLVRDVARIIASKDPHRFKVVEDVPSDQDWAKIEDESKFISLYCKAVPELPPRLVCPKLQFFILQSNSGASLNTIPNTFFEGMSQLKVLALSRMHFPTLPSTLQSLANLRTLCLDRCKLGRRLSFWMDPWYDETVLSHAFPTLFNLAAHKDARVADVWDSSMEVGGWSPVFLRPFNDWELEEVDRFLLFLHNKKISSIQEDRLLLKESTTVGFSVRHMYRKLMFSPPLDFPSRSIWNPIVPPKLSFFAWEASWGKVLTLDQLKRRGITLVNRCFLCEENEETIDHLLIHCSRAKMLWDLLLAITEANWVFPRTVRQLLIAWQSASVGKKRKRVWMAAPLCLFWTLWLERNRVVFENEVPSVNRMKSLFLFTLWGWAKMYSTVNLNSLVEFLTWLGYR